MSNQYLFNTGDTLKLDKIMSGFTGVIIDRWCLNGMPAMPSGLPNLYRYRVQRSDGTTHNYDEEFLKDCPILKMEELKMEKGQHETKFCVIGERASGYVGRRNWYNSKEEAAVHGVNLLRRQGDPGGAYLYVVKAVAKVEVQMPPPPPIQVKDLE